MPCKQQFALHNYSLRSSHSQHYYYHCFYNDDYYYLLTNTASKTYLSDCVLYNIALRARLVHMDRYIRGLYCIASLCIAYNPIAQDYCLPNHIFPDHLSEEPATWRYSCRSIGLRCGPESRVKIRANRC